MSYVGPALFGLFALAMLVIAITRRGKNLLSAIPPIEGEAFVEEHDIEFSTFPRRAALYTSLHFARGRLRVTTERWIITQPALGTGTPVVRYVIHLRPRTTNPTGWADGVTTFVLDPAKCRVDETGALRVFPAFDENYLPQYVLLRGEGVDKLV